MDVSFASERLRLECESMKRLRRKHGEQCARKVVSRLEDLRSASSLEEMRKLPGGCHPLTGDRKGQHAIKLQDGKRLIFKKAVGASPDQADDGEDWTRVDAVQILEIVDYH